MERERERSAAVKDDDEAWFLGIDSSRGNPIDIMGVVPFYETVLSYEKRTLH